MLNALARAADDVPAVPSATLLGGNGAGGISLNYDFDRSAFLERFRTASRSLDPDPYAGVSVFEQGADLLLGVDTYGPNGPGDPRIHARIDQPRRDLGMGYDPCLVGVVVPIEAQELLD
jgi:hypothetical protein